MNGANIKSSEAEKSFVVDENEKDSFDSIAEFLCEKVQSLFDSISDLNHTELMGGKSLDSSCNPTDNASSSYRIDEVDPKFVYKAGLEMIKSRNSSYLYLVEKLKISPNKAKSIVGCLEKCGLLGNATGIGPRKILMSEEEFKVAISELFPIIADNDTTKSTRVSKQREKNKKKSLNNNENPEIKMRSFSDFYIGKDYMGIRNNKIHLYKNIMTSRGVAHMEPEFSGSAIKKIIIKKSTMFKKGFFTFEFISEINIQNLRPDIIYADRTNVSDLIKIEFGPESYEKVLAFLKQISEDTGIAITFV